MKNFWLILFLSLISILLVGCGSTGSGGEEYKYYRTYIQDAENGGSYYVENGKTVYTVGE